MSDHAPVISHEAAPPRSLTEMMHDVVQDVGRIVQAEIRLARSELGGKLDKARKAAGAIGIAAIAGFLSAACLVTACITALALVVPLWLAALIMSVLLGIAAAGALAAGRSRLRAIDPVPEQTIHTLEDNIEWAKQRTRL